MAVADMRKPDDWTIDEIRQVVEVSQQYKAKVYASKFWRMLHHSRAVGTIKGNHLILAHEDRKLLRNISAQHNFVALIESANSGELSRTEAATMVSNEKVTRVPVFSDRVRVGVVGGGRLPLTIGDNTLAPGGYMQVKPDEVILDFEGVIFVENGECLTQWRNPPEELKGWLMVYRGHGDKERIDQDDESEYGSASEQRSAINLVKRAQENGLKTAAFYDYDPWGLVLLNSTLACFSHYVKPDAVALEALLDAKPNFNKSSIAQKQLSRGAFQMLRFEVEPLKKDKYYMDLNSLAVTQECLMANNVKLKLIPLRDV